MNTGNLLRRRTRTRLSWVGPLLVLTLTVSLVGGGLTWALQSDSGDPVALHPDPKLKGVTTRLEIGETLLLGILQGFANYVGRTVYAHGDIPPTTEVNLTRSIRTLDKRTATMLLTAHGYDLSEENIRGKRVFWVQKRLVRKRKSGSLNRRGSTQALPTQRDVQPRAPDRGASTNGSSLCLYRRQDGRGSRFVVLFETDSETDAQDALSLLQAHQSRQPTRSRD